MNLNFENDRPVINWYGEKSELYNIRYYIWPIKVLGDCVIKAVNSRYRDYPITLHVKKGLETPSIFNVVISGAGLDTFAVADGSIIASNTGDLTQEILRDVIKYIKNQQWFVDNSKYLHVRIEE